jgi:hypothetical protein
MGRRGGHHAKEGGNAGGKEGKGGPGEGGGQAMGGQQNRPMGVQVRATICLFCRNTFQLRLLWRPSWIRHSSDSSLNMSLKWPLEERLVAIICVVNKDV